jgi:hypothetical protein
MRKLAFQGTNRAPRLLALLVVCPLLLVPQACTDLTETPHSAITPENFYRNEGEVLAGLASVYAQLRTTVDDYYNLSEISTDEMIVPTRGQDWYDNGTWLEIHRQTWSPTSPSGLGAVNGAWVNLFQGVARANVLLEVLPNVPVSNKDVVTAELRTLRAFYYYLLMDMFGGVPIVTDTEIMPRPRATRAEVFAFVEQELNESREALPDKWDDANYGRMTKGAADAILASMYLNAQVFTGTVTEAGLQPGEARWQDAIDAADRILNSGVYSLATDWRSNFAPDNYKSPENIMVVEFLNENGLGLNFVMRALHYNQYSPPTPWNGFATLAETYNAFSDKDERKEIFLEGLQRNVLTGEPVNDRSGAPLFFDPTIKDPTSATEGEGVRIYKWPADPDHVNENNGNDYAHFRLAEIYLIKAEALNELNRPAEAIGLVNTLRARVFSPPQPLSTGMSQAEARDAIYKERLLELTAEGKRRTDMIRHGDYTAPFGFKAQTEPYRVLMPIPQSQIDANPELEQNPGY